MEIEAAASEQSKVWTMIPDPEEIPVTFQLGIIGEDGVLLASDTLCTAITPYRSRYNSPKIQLEEEKHVAYCWAGDALGKLLEQEISSGLDNLKYTEAKTFLQRAAHAAISKASAIRATDPGRQFYSCTLLITAPTHSGRMALWKVQASAPPLGGPQVTFEEILDRSLAGDQSTSAVFFTERYFPRNQTLPIRNLIPLAAHTVLLAGKLNPVGIGGLEMALCRPSGVERVTEAELEQIILSSESLDRDIGSRLFPS